MEEPTSFPILSVINEVNPESSSTTTTPKRLPKGYAYEVEAIPSPDSTIPSAEATPSPGEGTPVGGRSTRRSRPRINYAEIASPKPPKPEPSTPVASTSSKRRTPVRKAPPSSAPTTNSSSTSTPTSLGAPVEFEALAQTIETIRAELETLESAAASEPGPAKKKSRTMNYSNNSSPASKARPARPAARSKASPIVPASSRKTQAPVGVMKQCQKIITKLMRHRHAWPFNEPVDPVALSIPDYFDIIKNPMDFGTISKKLEYGSYADPNEFGDDVRLVFSNCRTYNAPGSDIVIMANILESETFEPEWAKLPAWQAEQVSKNQSQDIQHKLSELSATMLAMQEQMKSLTQAAQLNSLSPVPNDSPRTAQRAAPGSGGSASRRRAPPSMSLEEKRWLSDQITLLDPEHLVTVVQIIHESHPFVQNADGTAPDIIEIDIDSLELAALRKLMTFVKRATGQQPPSAPRRRSPANNRRPSSTSPVLPESHSSQPIEESDQASSTSEKIADVERGISDLSNEAPSGHGKEGSFESIQSELHHDLEDDLSSSSDTDSSTTDTDDHEIDSFTHENEDGKKEKDDPSGVVFGQPKSLLSTHLNGNKQLLPDTAAPKIIAPEKAPQPEIKQLALNPDRWTKLSDKRQPNETTEAPQAPAGWSGFLQKKQLEEQKERERQEREEQRERARQEIVEERRRDEQLFIEKQLELDNQRRLEDLKNQEELRRQREEAREKAKRERAHLANKVDIAEQLDLMNDLF